MLPEILNVRIEGGGHTSVPLTPLTTFNDVSACVRDPGDPLPLILEDSPLGARVVSAWERPLELLKLWGKMKEQVTYNASFTLSNQLNGDFRTTPRRSTTPDKELHSKIDPWELYELKDALRNIQNFNQNLNYDLDESSASPNSSCEFFSDPNYFSTRSLESRLLPHRDISQQANFPDNKKFEYFFPSHFNEKFLETNINTSSNYAKENLALIKCEKHRQHEKDKENDLNTSGPYSTVASLSKIKCKAQTQPGHKVHANNPVMDSGLSNKPDEGFFHRNSPLLKSFPQGGRRINKRNDDNLKLCNNIECVNGNQVINCIYCSTVPKYSKGNSSSLKNSTSEQFYTNSPLQSCNRNNLSNISEINKSVNEQYKHKLVSNDTHNSCLLLLPRDKNIANNTVQRSNSLGPINKTYIPESLETSEEGQYDKVDTQTTNVHSKLQTQPLDKIDHSPLKTINSFLPKLCLNRKSKPKMKVKNSLKNQKRRSKEKELKWIMDDGNVSVNDISYTSLFMNSSDDQSNSIINHLTDNNNSSLTYKTDSSHNIPQIKETVNNKEAFKNEISKIKESSGIYKSSNPGPTTTLESNRKIESTTKENMYENKKDSRLIDFPSHSRNLGVQTLPNLLNSDKWSVSIRQSNINHYDTNINLSPQKGTSTAKDIPQPRIPQNKICNVSTSRTDVNVTYYSRSTDTAFLKERIHEKEFSPTVVLRRRNQLLSRNKFVSPDHRRSYSDPLCENASPGQQGINENWNPRRARRRRHSGDLPTKINEMKDSQFHMQQIPDGGEVTLSELREMAQRQQHQIDAQQQLLVAREQRLQYLKQREGRGAQVTLEAERLRRLRERVEAQEAKLRRLRALRGQVDCSQLSTSSLSADLEAMRHLFSEKEKELVDAAAKVEHLTRQLEELRAGVKIGRGPHLKSGFSHLHIHQQELEKLRRELLYRNGLNRDTSNRLSSQKDALVSHKDEVEKIDKRIADLQQRLQRKRFLNQQLASQISAAAQAKQTQLKSLHSNSLPETPQEIVSSEPPDGNHKAPSVITQFERGYQDPKYQTLPHNTKFSTGSGGPLPPTSEAPHPNIPFTNGGGVPPASNGTTLVTRTVHSIPTHPPSKGLASAPSQVASSQTKGASNGNRTISSIHYQQQQQQSQHVQYLNNQGKGTSSEHSKENNETASSQDVENIRAFPPGSYIPKASEETVDSEAKSRPYLPPKPPAPPPRQKGDVLSNSDENLHKIPSGNGGTNVHARLVGQGRSQGYRYASQDVILSTYTQPQNDGKMPSSSNGNRKPPPDHSNAMTPAFPPPLPDHSPLPPSDCSVPQVSDSDISKVGPELRGEGSQESVNGYNNNHHHVPKDENNLLEIHVSKNRRIEMPPDFLFPEGQAPPSDLLGGSQIEASAGTKNQNRGFDSTDRINTDAINKSNNISSINTGAQISAKGFNNNNNTHILDNNLNNINTTMKDLSKLRINSENINSNGTDIASVNHQHRLNLQDHREGTDLTENILNNENEDTLPKVSGSSSAVSRRLKKGNLKVPNSNRTAPRRVSFDPLALLLDASLEGELELVRRTATEVPNPSAANDEGITALHNAICAGHLDIVTFLVNFGCDVNAQDSDGWTPLHCAASCNNLAMVRFLVEHGACVLATTLSDHETAAEKCERDEDGYDGCSQYLYSVQEKLGIMNGGVVYAVFSYRGRHEDELDVECGDALTVLRRGDEHEREWWWVTKGSQGINGDLENGDASNNGEGTGGCGYVPRNLLGVCPRVKNPHVES